MDGPKSLTKGVKLLKLVLCSGGRSVADIADELGIPLATTYRHLAVLEESGLVSRSPNGALLPGIALLERFDRHAYWSVLKEQARPWLQKMSQEFSMTAHLGVFDDEMVTYLLKVSTDNDDLFTVENKQLEGYCSGIGKVLLSHLPDSELSAYLDSAPFPALTPNTLTTSTALSEALTQIRSQGYGIDRMEFDENVFCVAAPVKGSLGGVVAAVSLSAEPARFVSNVIPECIQVLKHTCSKITEAL